MYKKISFAFAVVLFSLCSSAVSAAGNITTTDIERRTLTYNKTGIPVFTNVFIVSSKYDGDNAAIIANVTSDDCKNVRNRTSPRRCTGQFHFTKNFFGSWKFHSVFYVW